jgi:putative transposase
LGVHQEPAIMPFWRLFYHVVWSTKGRQPLIDRHASGVIIRTISAACEKNGIVLHAIATMPDHIHVAVSIPSSKDISRVIAQWKGASSHMLNHAEQMDGEHHFAWQTEYGIVSFSERHLDVVKAYIDDQPRRHAGHAPFWDLLEEAGPYSIPTAPPSSSTLDNPANSGRNGNR